MENEEMRLAIGQVGLGIEMHLAHQVIHAGRVAIKELLTHEPVDWNAVNETRQAVNSARREVTRLGPKIEKQKALLEPYGGRARWIIRCSD